MAQQLKLPDGRYIDYCLYGPQDGFPLVWIHGTPSAHIPIPDLRKSSNKKGIKVIAISRAGYGGSTRKIGRHIVDVVADLHALNQHLGVGQCMVGGVSGGGKLSRPCPIKYYEAT